MGLNKQTGNMYDFVTKTINPLCGECPHKCIYCYVEGMKKRFPAIMKKYSGNPRLDFKVLKQNLGKGKFYFIQSMGDLFAENVPDMAIAEVLYWTQQYPDNTYLFQSKNPARFLKFRFHSNMILGTTIESNRDYEGMSKAPRINERVKAMIELKSRYRTMITVEPLMQFDLIEFVGLLKLCHPYQINIGADSQKSGLIEPNRGDVLRLITELEKFTIVKNKSNLNRILNKWMGNNVF